ncbi:MAG: hypothetical protein WA891_20925 [Acidobacteriaceae bacterium]|jgi:uncharacterized membrane protein YagU involved in acid resistance
MASAVGSVVRIGLIAGTLDITENLVFNAFRHITPVQIFQYIASGLTGMWAFHGGMESVALGVAIHYAIALFWTVIYYAASRRLGILIRRPVVFGLVYGAAVYLVMNFVVLPVTRVPHARAAITVASRVSGVLALLFCIGVTVAVLVRRETSSRQRRIADSVQRTEKR